MLLELARWLNAMGWMPALFGYITFRAILGALTALLLSLWLGPYVIARLAQLKGGQPIRSDGPQSHFSKAGTPTMGGTLILMTIMLSTLLWADLRNRYVWVLVLATWAFVEASALGFIGGLDSPFNKLVFDDHKKTITYGFVYLAIIYFVGWELLLGA